MIGQRLGPYEITAKLGEGGMGEVYRATDTKLDREVAIKVLPAAFTADPERLARFEREAKLLAQLHHPNIASIFGLEEAEGVRALVMELVPGPTLDERLAAGAFSITESLSTALQIAQALEEAHEKGIVHRDLKPQNVKASSEGRVKVLDFGLAKAMDTGGAAASAADLARSPTLMHSPTLTAAHGTQLGVILGTAAYMAPEQARGVAVDKRADIWAFGVVLYEMLAGRRLFEGELVTDVLANVLKKEIDLAELPADTPTAIRQLLRRCLERNPKNRLHDIADARIVIEEQLNGKIEAAETKVAVAAGAGRLVKAVAAGALLLAFAFGALLWRQIYAVRDPLRYQRLTFLSQFINNARFAPDGQTIVFSAAIEGNRSELFVRRPEDPQPRPLAEGDVQLLAVSSKGELAVLTQARYIGHRTYIGTLARMPLAAASPREVLTGVTAADWSPDGSDLAVIRQVGDRSRLEYPLGKVLAESTGYLSDIRFSPRGDRIAYMPHSIAGDNRGPVVIVDLAGREVARSPEYWGVEGLAWSANGKRVLYSASAIGHRAGVVSLALDSSVRELFTDTASLVFHDMAPSGRWLVSTEDAQIALVARFSGESADHEVRLYGQSNLRRLSADGRILLFEDSSEQAGPNYSVYLQRADRSPPVRLGEGYPLDLSPDGGTVLAAIPSEPPRLMLYPTGAGEAREISLEGFAAYGNGAFLPDGRSVLICGAESGHSRRCFVRDLESAELRAVTPEGTDLGRLYPDADAVLARRAGGSWLRFPLDGGEPSEVPGLDERDEVIDLGGGGTSLLLFRPNEMPGAIERLDLATGKRSVLFELAPPDRSGAVNVVGASVSADGSAYAYSYQRTLTVLFSIEGAR